MHQCIKFILFWNDTLHVSDGLSVHHREFELHLAPVSKRYLFGCYMYSLELLIMDGKTIQNM